MIDKIKEYFQKFKQRKNKTSLILSLIIVLLVIYGIFTFIGMYISRINRNPDFIEVSGRIEGYEYHAGTKISGKVSQMYIEEGDVVKEGQVIALIYSKQLEAALAEALSDLKLAEAEHERYSRLYDERAIAKMEFDRVSNRYTVAKERVIAAQAAVEDTKIKAPISGTVVLKIVRIGEVVSAGTPLATIINMNDLYLNVYLATDTAGKVNLSDEARVYPDALNNEYFDAYVDKIAAKAEFTPKNVETKSQRAKLVFQIKLKIKENKGLKLKPGMPSSGVIKVNKDKSWSKYRR